MSDHIHTGIFISYSRADSSFVDRLEADLRARRFDTWVDRQRLEGGQHWQLEINRAIDRSNLVIVVLSPQAEESQWVQFEFKRALAQEKPIIPLIYRECHIPDRLAHIQAESLVGLSYDRGLLKLLDRLTHHFNLSPELPTSLGELYRRALAAEKSDLELASRLLQRIVDRDASYAAGEPARDLARVNGRLLPIRVEQLRREAQKARSSGEYGREAGALEALVALAPNDAWANEYLPIAQTNCRYLDLYGAIQDLIDFGNTAEAANKLNRLWQNAPYFRDPAGIAPKLGLQEPPTYEEMKEQKAAAERQRKAAEQCRLAEERARAAEAERIRRAKEEAELAERKQLEEADRAAQYERMRREAPEKARQRCNEKKEELIGEHWYPRTIAATKACFKGFLIITISEWLMAAFAGTSRCNGDTCSPATNFFFSLFIGLSFAAIWLIPLGVACFFALILGYALTPPGDNAYVFWPFVVLLGGLVTAMVAGIFGAGGPPRLIVGVIATSIAIVIEIMTLRRTDADLQRRLAEIDAQYQRMLAEILRDADRWRERYFD